MYSTQHVAILLRNFEECSWEERIDLTTALKRLTDEEIVFLTYIMQGWSIRAAGRKIGKPGHTHRRYMRYCRKIALFLEGGSNA